MPSVGCSGIDTISAPARTRLGRRVALGGSMLSIRR